MDSTGFTQYPWYGVVRDGSLQQGDFFFGLTVFLPDYLSMEEDLSKPMPGKFTGYDVVVLSQSCDLLNRKNQPLSVLVCPVFDLEDASKILSSFADVSVREEARQGKMPGHHMLAESHLAYFPFALKVAFFHQIFTVPFEYVRREADNPRPRMRLLPPYGEHLAQAFARFVMRVGLPQDIPSLRGKKK